MATDRTGNHHGMRRVYQRLNAGGERTAGRLPIPEALV
jgi:hypothetical protein